MIIMENMDIVIRRKTIPMNIRWVNKDKIITVILIKQYTIHQ